MEYLNAQPHPAFPLHSQLAWSKTGHGEELLPLALLLCHRDAKLGTGDGREKHWSGLRLFCKSGFNLPGTDFARRNDEALSLAVCLPV